MEGSTIYNVVESESNDKSKFYSDGWRLAANGHRIIAFALIASSEDREIERERERGISCSIDDVVSSIAVVRPSISGSPCR